MPETKTDKTEKIETEALKLKAALNLKAGQAVKDKKAEKNSIVFYILSILTALLIVGLIIVGVLFIAIKNNVNGMADSMRDSVQNIPVLNLALPAKPEPDDEKNMTEEQVRKKYTEIKNDKSELEKQLSDLKGKVDSLNEQLSAKDTGSSLLQQQKQKAESEKVELTKQNQELQKSLDDISAVIAKGDTASFKNYFEKVNPDLASNLYSQILKNEKMSNDLKTYCSIYEEMDASAVASIMEKMGTGKMPLIVNIMKNLKKETSGAILAEMTPDFAAKVSEGLAKEYNVGNAKSAAK